MPVSSPSTDATREQQLASIRDQALRAADANDAAHDGLHLRRVVANARWLLAEEARAGNHANAFVVVAAAWLHDVVQLPKGSGQPGEAASLSAQAAREMLLNLGVDESLCAAIGNAVAAHSYSGGRRPESLEAAIVQDADRLDALGAVGIARLWVTGAALGGLLHDADDPAAGARELDDRRFGLDHIERKLLKLPALMNTAAGRREADRRAAEVRSYRDAFLRELCMASEQGNAPVTADATSDDRSPLELAIERGELDAELVSPGVPTPTVPDAARALGVEPSQIVKSLLFQTPDGRVVLAVASGPTKVQRKRLAALVNARDVKLASPEVVLERTGYEAGGTAPVVHATPLDVIVDTRVMLLPVVVGGGGRVDALLRIRPDEIVRFTCARVADIAD